MNETLTADLIAVQEELAPRFKALRTSLSALKQATRLAAEEQSDALAMQKVQAKLEQANDLLDDEQMQRVVDAFGQETQSALDSLAFDFARELKEIFAQRGITVEGRPPRLVVDDLVLEINMGTRKAQWLYGKEPLTRPIPLSYGPILKAYERQRRAILEREIDVPEFMQELYTAWQQVLDKRSQRPSGGRVSLIELYSQVTLNRQNARFWNAPARSTFRDYERPLFVRDIVLSQSNPTVQVDGETRRMRLGGATKVQADSAARSVWIPSSALDGEYYATITFDSSD